MHSTYQNYRGTTGKPMLTHYLKLIVTQLPAALLASLTLLIFTIQPAHADFRKALTAYQARDGQTMLKEVQDAVDKKNDDGLILFLSVLERDATFSLSHSYLLFNEPYNEPYYSTIQGRDLLGLYVGKFNDAGIIEDKNIIPWLRALQQGRTQEFLDLLQKACERSSLESQFRLISLRSPYDIYDKFDMDELTAPQLKLYQESVYVKQLPNLADKGYSEILYFLSEISGTQKNKMWLKKLSGKQTTRVLLRRAANSLNAANNKHAEDKSLALIKSALVRPDASYFYDEIAYSATNYYLKKGDKKSLMQAYLWSQVDLTTTASPGAFLKFKSANGFKKLGLYEIDAAWNKSNMAQNYPYPYYSDLPEELQKIKHIELPDLIAKTQVIDIKKLPLLSFHRFDYDNQSARMGLSAMNYLIDIYADGRVNLAVGPRFDRTQNNEILLTLSPQTLNTLLAEFEQLGFENAPLRVHEGCSMAGCGIRSTFYITKRDQAKQRTVIYSLKETQDDKRKTSIQEAFPAKVFALLEKYIPTQQYRCGTLKERAYYQYCVDFDKNTIATANQGETK